MYAINPELCTFCKSCMEECPTGAIQEGAVDGKEVCVVSFRVHRLRRLRGFLPHRSQGYRL